MQVPRASNEAVDPETVQMAGVLEVKLTGSPELAVAVNARFELAIWVGIEAKVTICACGLTVKLCVTVGAAA